MAPLLRSLLVTLPVCVLLAATSRATDDVRFRRLSVEDGLSQSAVNCILQDRQGFLWLGTQDGLNRYDGHEFTVYRHRARDSSSISENYITCLLEDATGCLWIGTYNGGLNRFDRSQGSFQRFLRDPARGSGPSGNIIMDVVEDRSGNLWVASWGAGLVRYDPALDSWTPFSHASADPASLSDNRIHSLLVDRTGDLWICTYGGVDRYRPSARGFEHYRHDPDDPRSLSDNTVISACEDDRGDLWFGTSDGRLNRFDRARSMFVGFPAKGGAPRPVANHEIMAIVQDDSGILWVASRGGGVTRVDRTQGILSVLRHEEDDPTSLGGDAALSLYKDRAGTIWVGVDGGGVSNYDPGRFKFRHLRHRSGSARSLSNPLVRGMCEDRNGNLWVGTANGCIDRVGLHTGRTERFRTVRDHNNHPGSAMVLALLEDRDGNIWAGTDGDGLNLFDPKTGKFNHIAQIPASPRVIGSNYIMTLCEGRDGCLWIGTLGAGLHGLDRRTRQMRTYRRAENSSEGLSGNWIYALHEDRDGLIWIGTRGRGITVMDPENGVYRVYLHDPANPASLGHNTVHAFHEDRDGVIWVGTMGGGLDRLDRRTESFEHFTEDDGLPNNVVYGILEDTVGNLWISTNRGLCCFDPKTRSFRTYGRSDGLQSTEFNQGAYCRGTGGRLSFGGINGINIVQSVGSAASTRVPQVGITRVKVLDREVAAPGSAGGPVVISHDENLLSLEFAVLDFTAPEVNTCRYMLEGVDRDWVDAGARRYVSYANLNAGSYVFRVQGRNSAGTWNREGAALRVEVHPPVWETLWFRALGFALVLALGFGFYRSRIARMEREKAVAADFSMRLNEFQEKERKRIAGELHDGIGQNLLTIRNRLSACLSEEPARHDHRGALGDIAQAVQQTIEEVREVSADLHPHILDRLGLKRAIEAMARRSAEASGLTMAVSVDDVDGLVPPSAAINIYRIIQEGINNIVKHSHASECRVEVKRTETHVQIVIHDDGCGFVQAAGRPAPAMSTGYGLVSMQERARILRGRLRVESSPGRGTTVSVSIPLDEEVT